MENKQIVKNFYEAVVSKNLLQELPPVCIERLPP